MQTENGTQCISEIFSSEPTNKRLRHNEGDAMLVILSPSLVILSEAKNLVFPLRAGSVKNLIKSMGLETKILRLLPQNDIVTQSLNARAAFATVLIVHYAGHRGKLLFLT